MSNIKRNECVASYLIELNFLYQKMDKAVKEKWVETKAEEEPYKKSD